MDKQTLIAKLNQHVAGGSLDLPVAALESNSIEKQFALFLSGENLLLDAVTSTDDGDDSYTITGTGKNVLFDGAAVAARFTAGDAVELTLTAQAQSGWTLPNSFPHLEHTLASALQFTNTNWQLASQTGGAVEKGLSFQATLDTANSLGLFVFLIGNTDEVLTGNVSSIDDDVPTMRLAGAMRGGTDLGFIKLGAMTLALVTQAVPPVREGGDTQAGVLMEISTSLDFTAKGKPVQIPLTAGIYHAASSVRFDADTTQLISAGMDELSALLNSVDLSGLSFGEFRLENFVKLTELTIIADPSADAKLSSVALVVESAKSWKLLHRPDGSPFITLQNLKATLGIGAPFAAADFSAALHGEILLSDARINMNALMSPETARVEGRLDSFSHLSLGEIARHFLGETASHTPELSLSNFSFVVQPGQSYKLAAEIDDLWTLQLGGRKLDLNSLVVDWQFDVGSGVKADIVGEVQIAGADISVQAKYDTATGWDFSGALAEGQTIAIEDLLIDFLYFFNVEPPEFVRSIELDKLAIHFNTTSKNFDFTIGGGLPVDDKRLEILLKVHIRNDDKFTFELSGTLTIGDFEFDLAFAHGSADNRFVAAYSHTNSPSSLPLRSFVADNLSSTVAAIVPDELHVDIKDILFAFDSTSKNASSAGANSGSANGQTHTQAKFVFALNIGTNINLSNLPLVGQEFPPEQTVAVDDLQLVIASKDMSQTEVAALNELVPNSATKLPGGTQDDGANPPESGDNSSPDDSSATTAIAEGLTISAMMKFGESESVLSMPVGGSNKPDKPAVPNTTAAAPVADNTKWFTVQKTFGPVHFERIGVQYQDASLAFLLDVALSAAGLTLSLEGLSVGSRLDKFSPQFNLHGLGIDYQNGAVEIGGAFLKTQGKTADDTIYEEYAGTAIIKTEQFNLSAIGAYAKLNNHPSLFVYSVLNDPIGGPAFFFVTGLAAGFGYNRALIIPPMDEIAQFPLVAEAVTNTGEQIDLGTELVNLRDYISPAIGEMFLAVGIKFTSFKIIDSFALLTFSFGSRFEMNLLGLSTLIVPTPIDGESVTPLAEAQMALKATFVPDEGFLGVSAQLTSASYILSKDCHLTGGYAFYSWFSGEHEGDFVQTLGGYHPSFNVPDYYPKVPQLGFNWRVDDHITIKGGLYYALTASSLMAGGFLQAVWEDGDLSAWFNAGADFLISWKPYHYDARIYVDMGVSYSFNFFGRHTISVDIGADLHVWGPEFAGHAHIHLWIVSFDVSFGGSTPALQPIDWQTFRDSFLPKHDEDICSITVKDGLVKGTEDKNDFGIINPTHFALVTNSVIPSNGALIGEKIADKLGQIGQIGIGSMAVAPNDFTSMHTITVTCRERDSEGVESDQAVEVDFEFTPVLKNVPAALWGRNLTPDLNGQALIEQALSGFEIRPKGVPKPGETAAIDRRNLQYSDPKIIADAFGWETLEKFTAKDSDDPQKRKQDIASSISSDVAVHNRTRILQWLGISAKIDLSDTVAGGFLIAPMIEDLSEI